MYCKQCGKELPDGSVFCPDCGAQQTADAPAAAPAATAAPAAGGTFLDKVKSLNKRAWAILLLCLGLLNFILPFVKVPLLSSDLSSLFGQTLKGKSDANYSGLQLITTLGVRKNSLLTDGGDSKNKFNIFAIAALVLGILALVWLIKGKASKKAGIFTACGAGALFLMTATFGAYYGISDTGISASPSFGLIFAMLFFLSAMVFCFLDKDAPSVGFPFINQKPAALATPAAAAAAAVQAVKESASGAVDAVKDAASDAADAVKDTASGAVDAVKDTASDAVDAVKDTASGAVDAVKDTASDAVDAAKDTASDAADAAKDIASDAASGLKND
ncbi:MAG: zinc ribbon domain-containing protein [Oscillospiraceae bacterium]|nr:zinc ribbon domain-containing protein [Oscillospiraceae bacterium]